MSVLEQWQDRFDFAAFNHEQRFQTKLVTKRRLFNAIVNYPLTKVQNDLLRPDLNRDPITGKKPVDPETGKRIRKFEFDAAAWRFIDDVLIGAGGGQFIRSYAFAYDNNKAFRDVHGASRALEGFGMAAESYDEAPRKLSEEIKDGRSHAVYDLINHSANASELLDRFVHGQLDITPSNVAKLQRNLSAMAKLCEEKAQLREAYDSIRDPEARAAAEKRGDKNDASGYIRDVIRLESISTPRQAQILSGFVAALMVDAAKPLGTEMYVPQTDIFMEPEDAVKISEFIDLQMEERGFVPNVSLSHNERPFPDMPEGMMVKQERNQRTGEITGCRLLTQQETLSFANAVHGHIKKELESKIENMLRYVDKHFDEIENSIARSQEDPNPAPIPVWDKQSQQSSGIANIQDKIRHAWSTGHLASPMELIKGVGAVAATAVRHVSRPEARYETSKLFGRAIAAQLVSYPVKVLDEALKSFLRYSGGEYDTEGSKERRGGYDKVGKDMLDEKYRHEIKKEWVAQKGKNAPIPPELLSDAALERRRAEKGVIDFPVEKDKKRTRMGEEAEPHYLQPAGLKGLDALIDATQSKALKGELFDKDAFQNNLKSNTFRLLTAPLAASVGTVVAQELYHLPKGVAIEHSAEASTVLKSAIKTGYNHAPQVAQRLKAMQGAHPAIEAMMQKDKYKTALPVIAAKSPSERSDEDYALLASYYSELSEVCLSVAEEVMSPYGIEVKPEKISSIDEAVTRVLRHPSENMPDAMIAMAYVQTFIDINAEKTSSVEYVDPTQLLIKHGDLRRLAKFVDDQAKAAGLVIAQEGQVEGIEAGTMLERNQQTGQLQPVSEATLIRYSNVVVEELKKHVDIDNLLYAVKGKNSEDYLCKIEQSVFGENHFKVGSRDEQTLEDSIKTSVAAPETLTEKWQDKVKRKGSRLHENVAQNLRHPEVRHEIRKLFGRSKGEAISAFIPGLIYNSLQHNEPIFSRSGMYSAVFKTAVYPVMYSSGVVAAKEAINEAFLKRRHIINETNVAQSLIEGAISTSGMLDAGLRDSLIEANQVHADMLALEKKEEYKDIPRIAAKPRELREEGDHALMQRFCEDVGSKMVDNSTRIFSVLSGGKHGEAMEDVVERALERPVQTLNDAVITLSFMHSMLGANAHNLDVLTYVSPKDKVLERNALRAMSEFMNNQAANAGFAVHGVPVQGKNGSEFTVLGEGDDLKQGELLQWSDETQKYERAPEESVIRYANVVTAKFRELAQQHIEKDAEGLVDKYKKDAKANIFKHLKAPAKEMPQHEVDGRFSEIIANETARGGFDIPKERTESHQARVLNNAVNAVAPPTR
jgi:hypothetical protein